MIYVVVLIEYGRVRHRWVYDEDRFSDACHQLETLLDCYSDVIDAVPILIKCCQYTYDHLSTHQILSSLIIP